MSEIDEKEIKRRFEVISQFEPGSEVTARDLEKVRKRLAEQTSRQQTREQKIWRIIMENRITKLTATALIIIVVILTISLWDKSTRSINSKVEIDYVYDTDKAKQVILLVVKTDKLTLESKVDPETKLPMSMNLKLSGQPQPGQIGQSINEIYYDLPSPEGIFEFEIPEGAEVKEKVVEQ